MSCFQEETLMAYLENELNQFEYEKVKKHLKFCPHCQQTLNDLEKIWERLEEIYDQSAAEIHIPDDWIQEVLSEIESINANAPKRSDIFVKKERQKRSWRTAKVAAASLIVGLSVAGAVLYQVSPAFADMVRFTFAKMGIGSEAAKNISTATGYQVTDQGYTFQVEEVFFDLNQIMFAYSVVNEQGKKITTPVKIVPVHRPDLDRKPDPDDVNTVTLTDQNGNPLVDFENYGETLDKAMDGNVHAFTIRQIPHQLPDKVYVHVQLNEINGNKGSWKLKFPVDLSKSKQHIVIHPLNYKIEANGGIAEFRSISYTPASTKIELYDPSPKANPVTDPLKTYVKWKIVDEKGRVIADGINNDNLNEEALAAGDGMITADHWVYQFPFKPFPKVKKLTLIVEGINGKPIHKEFPMTPS